MFREIKQLSPNYVVVLGLKFKREFILLCSVLSSYPPVRVVDLSWGGGNSTPRGHLVMPGDTFVSLRGVAIGI